MQMEMQAYLWICLIVFFAGFIQGLSGFGSILLALPLLAIFLDIKAVIPLVALYGLSISFLLLVQLRKHLEWKKVFPLLLGATLGIPVGVFFLKKLDRDIIHYILGIILISYSLYSLFFRTLRNGIGEAWAYVFGFLAGCLGGALSASGPPVIVYTSLQSWGKDRIKVTLQTFFVIAGLMVVFGHAISGVTTIVVLRLFGISMPTMILGTYVGSYFYGMTGEQWYRRIIFILLALLGVFMIYKAN
jgi:uncharacterized membrane protein YfcA